MKNNCFKILFLISIVLISYYPALQGGFVWDDMEHLLPNPDLSNMKLIKLWTGVSQTAPYYPLTLTFFWVENKIFNFHSFGYHFVNVVFHIMNALILWRLLLCLKFRAAYLAALIFAVHPVHVESVAWIAQLKNCLSGFFFLLTLLVVIKTQIIEKDKSWFPYVLSLFLFTCALLSKTVTCTLPLVLLLLIYREENKISMRNLKLVIPFFILSLIAGLITVGVEKGFGAEGDIYHYSVIERMMIASQAIYFYISKLIWPASLCFVYPRWTINSQDIFEYGYLFLMVGISTAFWMFRSFIPKDVKISLLYFFMTILPVLGFINMFGWRYSYVTDHYQYIPSIGIIICLAALIDKFDALNRYRVISVIMIGLLAALTFNQGKIYKNNITLFSDVIRKNPDSWMAYNNRGIEYRREGRYKDAFRDFQMAIYLKPDHARAYNNRALVYQHFNNYQKALEDYEMTIHLEPNNILAYKNKGNLLAQTGHIDLALQQYAKALEIHPNFSEVYYSRALVYISRGQMDLARKDMIQALNLRYKNINQKYVSLLGVKISEK